VQAKAADVFYGGDSLGQIAKGIVFQDERIAAAENHLVNRGIPGQVSECLFEPPLAPRKAGSWVVPAEAKPAMDAALASCYDEGSASVLGEQTGSGGRTRFAKRVPTEPLHNLRFRGDRQDLAEERIVRVSGADALQVGARHEHSEGSRWTASLLGERLGQIE
jgi:hypothetical protein